MPRSRSRVPYRMPRSRIPSSFNDSFRAQSGRWRKGEAECFGRLRVDHEFELRGSLDRNVRGLGTFEDLVHEDRDAAIESEKVRAVAEKSSGIRIVDKANRRKAEFERGLRDVPE